MPSGCLDDTDDGERKSLKPLGEAVVELYLISIKELFNNDSRYFLFHPSENLLLSVELRGV
jgi:hypothetical protein